MKTDEKIGFGMLIFGGLAAVAYACFTRTRLEDAKRMGDTRLHQAATALDAEKRTREQMALMNKIYEEEMKRPTVAMMQDQQVEMLAQEIGRRLFIMGASDESDKKKPN